MGKESTFMEMGTCLGQYSKTASHTACVALFFHIYKVTVIYYLLNDPEYYDEQRNPNSHKNVDGENQGVECSIPL